MEAILDAILDLEFYVITPLVVNITFSSYHFHLTTMNVKNAFLSQVCVSSYMLYLKNRNRYRHVLGTKISGMSNFIINFNTFMGLKINAF